MSLPFASLHLNAYHVLNASCLTSSPILSNTSKIGSFVREGTSIDRTNKRFYAIQFGFEISLSNLVRTEFINSMCCLLCCLRNPGKGLAEACFLSHRVLTLYFV